MIRHAFRVAASLAAAAALAAFAPPGWAIALGQVDDFEDGTTMSWRGNQTFNVLGEGRMGVDDNVLRVDSFNRMIAVSDFDSMFLPTQWTGNYTSATVEQLSMNVRNPNLFPLHLYVGISDDTISSYGVGATYVTDYSIVIPADDEWHSVRFSITPSDFVRSLTNTEVIPVGAAAILDDVYHLRILHSTIPDEFRGDETEGHFYLDNISTQDADFDADRDVDGADFLVWQRGLGVAGTQSAGDADYSGGVSATDLRAWRNQFGLITAPPAVLSVPEPTAAAMAALLVSLLRRNARRRRHSAAQTRLTSL